MMYTWTTKEGTDLIISEMGTEHIKNCISMLKNKVKSDTHSEYTIDYLVTFEEELEKRARILLVLKEQNLI